MGFWRLNRLRRVPFQPSMRRLPEQSRHNRGDCRALRRGGQALGRPGCGFVAIHSQLGHVGGHEVDVAEPDVQRGGGPAQAPHLGGAGAPVAIATGRG